jgi:hypothetical protein
MALFTRRRPSDDDGSDDGSDDDFEDELDDESRSFAGPRRTGATAARSPSARPVGSRPERTARPTTGPDGLRPIDLRGWEIQAGYLVAVIIAAIAVLELLVTGGAGAPTHTDYILPVVALALAVGQAATIPRHNRLITGVLGIVAGLIVDFDRVPNSLVVPHSIAIFAPLVYAFLVTQRYSRAQRALQPPRQPRQRGGASARSSRRAKAEPEPTGPKANRRYTPPKPRDQRSPRKR